MRQRDGQKHLTPPLARLLAQRVFSALNVGSFKPESTHVGEELHLITKMEESMSNCDHCKFQISPEMEACPKCGTATEFGELVNGWTREESNIIGWIFVGLGIILFFTYYGSLAGIPSIGIGLYSIHSRNRKIEKKKMNYLKSLVGNYKYVDRDL